MSTDTAVPGRAVPGAGAVAVDEAPEPVKTTSGEQLMYGPFAPLVREVTTAAAHVHNAARIAARMADEGRQIPRSIQAEARGAPEGWPAADQVWAVFAALNATVIDASREVSLVAMTEIRRQQFLGECDAIGATVGSLWCTNPTKVGQSVSMIEIVARVIGESGGGRLQVNETSDDERLAGSFWLSVSELLDRFVPVPPPMEVTTSDLTLKALEDESLRLRRAGRMPRTLVVGKELAEVAERLMHPESPSKAAEDGNVLFGLYSVEVTESVGPRCWGLRE